MGKGSNGSKKEIFTSANSKIASLQRGRSISCNQMARTHSTLSNLIKSKMKSRRKKSAKDTR